jgi:hypothetical protein
VKISIDNRALSVDISRIEVLSKQSAGEAFALRYASGYG